ncbi:uncharacterized protein [Lepeophtheirus salmonis]|nr:uncharacterized protein LOC121121345 [Lepeophtheirus salmonis]
MMQRFINPRYSKGADLSLEDSIELLIHLFEVKKLSYQKIVNSVVTPFALLNNKLILRCLESFHIVEEGINYGINADNDLVYRLTPRIKYWKYIRSSADPSLAKSLFWTAPFVKSLILDIFSYKKDLFSVAEILGVTSEMICSNIVKSQIKNSMQGIRNAKSINTIPLKEFPTLKNYNYNDFWNETPVKSILEEIRCKKLSLEEGKQILGVSMKKLRTKIGIKEFTSMTREDDKKIDKSESSNKESPYEQIRNKNINERNDLLKKLLPNDFGSSRKKRKYNRRNYGPESKRKPSGRIQMKKPSAHSSVLYSIIKSTKSPLKINSIPPVSKMDLDDFFVNRIDYQKGKRMLFQIWDSFNSPEEYSCQNWFSNPLKMTQFSENKIQTCDILESSSIIVTGDKFGEVGIGKCNDEILSFRVHSGSINSVSFNWCGRSGKKQILSSGIDGYFRGLDLGAQKLEILYQWSYHDSLEKEILWHRQISEEEVVLGFEKYYYVFDVRSGKREIKLLGGNGFPISQNMAYSHTISIPTKTGFRLEDLRKPNKEFYAVEYVPTYGSSNICSVLFNPVNGTDLLINSTDKKVHTILNWSQNKELHCIVPMRKNFHTQAKWGIDSMIIYSNAKACSRNQKRKHDFHERSNISKKHLGFPHASSIYALDIRSNKIIGEISDGISESIVEIFSDHLSQRFVLGNCAGKGTIGLLH